MMKNLPAMQIRKSSQQPPWRGKKCPKEAFIRFPIVIRVCLLQGYCMHPTFEVYLRYNKRKANCNVYDKIQHPFMIRTLQKMDKGTYLNIIKVKYGKLTANFLFSGEKLKDKKKDKDAHYHNNYSI